MVRLRFETDLATSLKAAADLGAAYDKVGSAVTGTASEMKKLELAAKRITDQNLTPQEKYNQKLGLMAKAVKAGKLEMTDAERTAARLRMRLDETAKSSDKVFGASSVAAIGRWASGFAGVTAILAGIKAGFAAVEKQSQDAADNVFQNYGSFAALQAVSGNEQEFGANVAFARDLVSRGVVSPQKQGQAADITAGLIKARLTAADREVIASIGESDILQPEELVKFGEGVREFRDVFKSQGTFRDTANQLIEAGKQAKISPGEVGSATTKFGRTAIDNGFTSEQALAAYTTILQTSPNARTAATRTEKFFKGEYAMTPDQKKLFSEQQGLIGSAASRDVLGKQGGLVQTDNLLAAADTLQTSQGETSQIVQRTSGEKEILLDIITNARERQAARHGTFAKLEAWFENTFITGTKDAFDLEDSEIRGAVNDRTGLLNSEERQRMSDYLKRIAESNEAMKKDLQAPRPSGRQEQ